MTPICKKEQRDYDLIDGFFHKDLEIHVNNSLKKDNQHSNKGKLPYFDDAIMQ